MTAPNRYASFLFPLFVGTIFNAMVVSFMGFYIVEDLRQPPVVISAYTGLFAAVVILPNRIFAKRLNLGANPFL